MPIENIIPSQNQGRLFEERLSKKLNPKNKLYQIRDLINWTELERQALSHIEIKQFGRNRKDHRLMLALLMLQEMYNGSDTEKVDGQFKMKAMCLNLLKAINKVEFA